MIDREDFLSESKLLPKDQDYRLILGYAWERLINEVPQEDSSKFVWPWFNTSNASVEFNKDIWRGNFLAFPNFPFAFMYPGWTETQKRTFRSAYRNAGNTHLPIGIWGSYPRSGHPDFDYSSRPTEYLQLLNELRNDGIEPCVFVITDAVNNQTSIKPRDAKKFCDFYLPKIRNSMDERILTCLGWELNQVSGWSEHQDKMSGHHMIDLSRYIRWNLPNSEIFAHFQPNWWAPHYEGLKELDWWDDAKEVNGLLFQIRPESSLKLKLDVENEDDDPSSEDGLYLALKYRGAANVSGVKERIELLCRRKFVMFEHSQQFNRWQQVVDIVKENYC